MIEAKSLTKHYGSRKAISDVSFTIHPGEIVGFLGPNGAGKTTTMKILTGYMAPTSGRVYLDRLDVFEEPLEAKKKLGYLPEIPPVYLDMKVEDYLRYVACLKLCPKNRVSALVEEAMEKANIHGVRKRIIGNLSKGFKQRTGLAQALVSSPEILVLDEPTAGLDPKQVIEIRETLKQLKGQHTVILSTHILSEVQISCDRVIIINQGQIIAEESLEDLSNKMRANRQIFLKVKKNSEDLIPKLKSIKGVLSVNRLESVLELSVETDEGINAEVAKAALSGHYGFIELKERDFSLEDVFINLTNDKDES